MSENYEGKRDRAGPTLDPGNLSDYGNAGTRFATASSEWIFAAPTKSGHIDRSTIAKQHTAAVKASRVEPFVIYSLRHTCLTRWAEAGMNPHELMSRGTPNS